MTGLPSRASPVCQVSASESGFTCSWSCINGTEWNDVDGVCAGESIVAHCRRAIHHTACQFLLGNLLCLMRAHQLSALFGGISTRVEVYRKCLHTTHDYAATATHLHTAMHSTKLPPAATCANIVQDSLLMNGLYDTTTVGIDQTRLLAAND